MAAWLHGCMAAWLPLTREMGWRGLGMKASLMNSSPLAHAVSVLQIGNPADLDAVFVAVGGGGLIAGIGAYIKALQPHVKVG
jgi:hypothetical protein